jgi:hypothetical protein
MSNEQQPCSQPTALELVRALVDEPDSSPERIAAVLDISLKRANALVSEIKRQKSITA